jgi:hypothetical protein
LKIQGFDTLILHHEKRSLILIRFFFTERGRGGIPYPVMKTKAKHTIPLGSADSSFQPTVEIRKMLRALRETNLFEIEEDTSAGTIEVIHTDSGKQVLAAIQKEAGGSWITRIDKRLFA